MRVVLRSDDPRQVREAQARLGAAGIEALALPSLTRAAPDGEDISVFCGAAMHESGAPAQGGAAPGARALTSLLATSTPPPLALSEKRLGRLDLSAPAPLLHAQFEAQIRVALLEEECARRTATAAELALGAPKSAPKRPLKLLYVGAPSASFLALEQALAAQDGAMIAAFSSFSGFDHLHDETFDAVVLNGAEDTATALSLCSALRRNTSLYHMPTMVLIAPGDETSAAAAIERGASAVTAAHEACGASLAWLFEAIRRERRRQHADHALRALRDLMGDARTGLFQPAPFQAHLTRLAADHQRDGRPLSMISLRVLPAFGAGQPAEEVWRRGFGEIASLAQRLLREVDCSAALSRDLIAIALPASNAEAARRSAERIASVAECTAFAAGDNGAGPLVFERAIVELQPGESGPGLLARALRAIEQTALSA